MYEQSHPRLSALVITIIVCLSWAGENRVRDSAITYKASATKCQRTEAGERGSADVLVRQRDVAALDAKYTKELADAKAENDALRDDNARWSSSVAHQSSLSVSA